MKPMTRVVHFDFHTMPKIDDFGARFDAEAFADTLASSHVAYINMFARCNIGFSYYPTKVGFPYPGYTGNMLGDTVRACHARGVKVIGYIHVGLHHELCRVRPDYARMEKDGTVYNYRAGANWFRQPCFFGPYVDHVLEEVKEVLALGVDGLFLDGIAPRDCACPRCLSEMRKRGMDIADDADISAFAAWAARAFAEKIRALVPSDKYLYFKGLPLAVAQDLNTHGEIACLASNMGYDFFPAQAALARGLYRGRLYMNGRFGYDWGDFGGYKGKCSVENDFYEALMNGCGTTLGDHLHPAENMEAAIYRDIADIYGWMEKLEAWTNDADYLAEIAILTKDGTAGASHEGAARILSELKYTYNILATDADFSAYPLVILPDDIRVDEALAAKLSAYLAAGGRVLSSGEAGLSATGDGFALPAWDFTCAGSDPTEVSYYKMRFASAGLADMRYEAYERSTLVKAAAGNEVLADHVTTYFNRDYDGAHWYFYTPPRNETGYAAALLNTQGNVAHVAFPIFRTFRKTLSRGHRALVGEILARLLPAKLIRAEELPITTRATVLAADDYRLLCLKVTYPENRGEGGSVEEHTVLSAGRKIALKGEYAKAYLLPEKTPLAVAVADGYTTVTLPEVTGFATLLFE